MVASDTTKEEKGSALPVTVMTPNADQSKQSGAVTTKSEQADKPKPTRKKRRSRSKSKAQAKNVATSVDLAKGTRGIDTLLRNAYRSQLDMLALAATKANIMISLNGLLMSMLIISGTHLVSINAIYMIPIGLFLVTCAFATTFAVFAARPQISRNKFTYDDFMRDEARLMVFEEFSDLPESEYIDAMSILLKDPVRTYRSMLAHIHELGVTADKKYRNLYYSYTAFMAGTILTVVSLITLVVLQWRGVFALV